MIYLYAYTNHKDGLDNLRRVAAIYFKMREKKIDCEILVNEYRAQLIAKDWGLPLATTIETIKDIDAVATIEDTIIIDSLEKLEGKVLAYPEYFKKVIYLNSSFDNIEFEGAEVVDIYKDGAIFRELNIDKNREGTIYIFGDSDYNKIIFKNLENFKNKELDFYWGLYFFVKYEDEIGKYFNKIIESEDYYEVIGIYENIVTSSINIAIEAKANGANVYFFAIDNKLDEDRSKLLDKMGITETLDINAITYTNNTKSFIKNINNNIDKIINIIDN